MCGFVGIIGMEPVAPALCLALQSLQHRGQDAAGIGTFHQGKLVLHKELGLISQALPPATVARMHGTSGIAHVRYPTAGTGIGDREDAQPFLTRRPGMLLAHNGNVTNVPELEASLASTGWQVISKCDAEPILLVLADELLRRRHADHTLDDLEQAVRALMSRVRGAYTAVCVLQVDGRETLVAFRDPHGIRPGVYGRDPASGAWMAASESVALDVLDFEAVGHIPPGAMVVLRTGEAPIVRAVLPRAPRHCLFERIYFARPDSVMEEGRVTSVRWRLGEALAEKCRTKGIAADVVVAIPDTSRDAAQAIAESLALPNREGFIKNRYSGRTFIMPDAVTRSSALRLKLNPIREVFEGRRVILVDDSIVRGTTMRRIVRMIEELRPSEVHLAIFSPPVVHPCFYGVDMPNREDLVAARFAPEERESKLAEYFGVTSLTFLDPSATRALVGPERCAACFDGDYVVPVSQEERAFIRNTRTGAEATAGDPPPNG
jgi:amidophosphoribosyltransferase